MTLAVEETTTPPMVDDSSYWAFWEACAGRDLLVEVEAQVEAWLRNTKDWDPPTEETGLALGPAGMEFLSVHRETTEGRAVRYRLTQPSDLGEWYVTLTASVPRVGTPWLALRVSNSEGRFADRPKLAEYLTTGLELRDGGTHLTAEAIVIRGPRGAAIADEVTHEDRQGLYFVAGSDERLAPEKFESHALRVQRLTRQVAGMAQVVVLDPIATVEFNAAMGASHEVPPWTIRTFEPDVDPAVAANGRHHRILGRQRLAGSDGSVRMLLGRIARRHASQRPRPASFGKLDRTLGRLEDKILVDRLVVPTPAQSKVESEPPPPDPAIEVDVPDPSAGSVVDDVETYLAQIALVKETFGLASLDPDALDEIAKAAATNRERLAMADRLTKELESRRSLIDKLKLDVVVLRAETDDKEEDLQDALESRDDLTDKVRWLQKRLVELEDFANAYAETPGSERTKRPSSFSELADWLHELEDRGVVFTGEASGVRNLDDHDHLGRMARTAWDCLDALCDYIRARTSGACTGGLRQYFDNTPPDHRSVGRKKFAAKETKSTMSGWGDQRRFPVPDHVDTLVRRRWRRTSSSASTAW